MLQQLLAQSLNGFTVKDLPFLILQLSVSSILACIIRIYWRKSEIQAEEEKFINYLIPVQIIFTSVAVFSIGSPWMIILFGLLALVPASGGNTFSLKSKVFYLTCVFVAYGCGAANLVVTTLVTLFLIIPMMHFYRQQN